MSLGGKPLLLKMIERVKAVNWINNVVVATTTNDYDLPIYKLCKDNHVEVFRGHPEKLIDRYYKAASKYCADAVVILPTTSPLIDPSIISKVIRYYISNQNSYDYVSNLYPSTYPEGNEVEMMSIDTLHSIWNLSKNASGEQKFILPFILNNFKNLKLGNVEWEIKAAISNLLKLSVDYEEDYLLVKRIFDKLYFQNSSFNLFDIIALLENNPELKNINIRPFRIQKKMNLNNNRPTAVN